MELASKGYKKYLCFSMCILAVIATFVPVFRENVLFWWISDGMELSGLVKLAAIQAVTAAGILTLCGYLTRDITAASAGAVLYLTCPYRIYILFDYCDPGKCVAWAVLPWLLWGFLSTYRGGRIKWLGMVVASVSLAVVGYSDFVWFVITLAVILPAAIYLKRMRWLMLLAAGTIAGFPGILPYLDFCLRGGREELGVSLQSIMDKGYEFGQMFTGFAYRDNLPGMGIGLFIVIVIMLWLGIVEKKLKFDGVIRYSIIISMILYIISLSCFPWDFVERIGMIFMRAVSMIGTPTVFFGYGCGLMCILAAYAIKELGDGEGGFAAKAAPVFVMCISIFAAFHLGFDM